MASFTAALQKSLRDWEHTHRQSERLEARFQQAHTDCSPGSLAPAKRRRAAEEVSRAFEELHGSLLKEEQQLMECLRRIEERTEGTAVGPPATSPPRPRSDALDVRNGLYLYPDERSEAVVPVGCQVAARVSNGFWILCRVLRHIPMHDKYVVEDADDQEHPLPLGCAPAAGIPKKRYTLSSRHLVRLPADEADPALAEYPPGAQVHAVYPSTTTFYPAVVKSSFRKRKSREYLLAFDGDDPADVKAVIYTLVVFIRDGGPAPTT
eukprot:EG_transcript_22567